ncbi:MAG: hypothetical protein CM15mP46_6910 [Alphaproteobacteria bacterium]|nr:MAG: hypothetical protein CM15mP46_6910 [Alphaproteobacteria bacterium]
MPFLPNYAAIRETFGQAAASKLAAEAQIFLILVLSVLVIIAEIFYGRSNFTVMPGFANTLKGWLPLSIWRRITMPYLPLISIVALWALLPMLMII